MKRNNVHGSFLPSLATHLLFAALYLYIALLITDYFGLSPLFALAVPLLLAASQYLFFPPLLTRLFSEARWLDMAAEFPELAGMLEERLGHGSTVFPPLGVHPSPYPFTCTYGRLTCRVLVSQGMLDILTREEQLMVLLHELHHARSLDYTVFMCTGLIPFLLYSFTRFILFLGVGMATMKGTRSLSSFGLMLWWLKNQSYLLLYIASRAREGPADRFAAPDPVTAGMYRAMLRKIEDARQNSGELTIRIERMAFALNFLSITDPFPAYYRGLTTGIKQGFETYAHNHWLAWFELFSSHPISRCGEDQPCTGNGGDTGAASLQSQSGKELALYLLPCIMACAGSLPALLKGGWLGLPFLLAGLSLIILLRFHYPGIRTKPSVSLQSVQPFPASGLTGIPARVEGFLTAGEVFSINPLLSRAQCDGASLPLFIRALFPADAVLSPREETVEISGWLRKSPFLYLEARDIRIGKKHLYQSCYPLLLNSLSWGSILFGFFLTCLQFKGG